MKIAHQSDEAKSLNEIKKEKGWQIRYIYLPKITEESLAEEVRKWGNGVKGNVRLIVDDRSDLYAEYRLEFMQIDGENIAVRYVTYDMELPYYKREEKPLTSSKWKVINKKDLFGVFQKMQLKAMKSKRFEYDTFIYSEDE